MHPELLTSLNAIAAMRVSGQKPDTTNATAKPQRRHGPPRLRWRLPALALGASLALAGCGGGGDLTRGAQLAQEKGCTACHGMDGMGTSPAFPHLRGQYPSYLYAQLEKYRSGVRVNAIMNGQAAGLTDDEMADLTAFYAGD